MWNITQRSSLTGPKATEILNQTQKTSGGILLAQLALKPSITEENPKKQSAAPSWESTTSTKEVVLEQIVPHPEVLVFLIHLHESLYYSLVDHKVVEAEHLGVLAALCFSGKYQWQWRNPDGMVEATNVE